MELVAGARRMSETVSITTTTLILRACMGRSSFMTAGMIPTRVRITTDQAMTYSAWPSTRRMRNEDRELRTRKSPTGHANLAWSADERADLLYIHMAMTYYPLDHLRISYDCHAILVSPSSLSAPTLNLTRDWLTVGNSRPSVSKYQRSRIVNASRTPVTARRTESTNGADHPRFRGSLLYACTFRTMVWSALAFFLIGMLLRVYVISASFLKTANPKYYGGSGKSRSITTTTYYYYCRAAVPAGHGSTGGSLKSTSPSRSQLPVGSGGGSGGQENGYEEGRDEGAEGGGMDSSVWSQGIREVFTVRRILGWDCGLLAYPISFVVSVTLTSTTTSAIIFLLFRS
ncbi:MAG: hypothetical protein JOS17DRAFT_829365 [Linnemannia elongata]|nr:MAG: hypothetical protein JOS17DRAFT_829365 [Linnemannia elongata]